MIACRITVPAPVDARVVDADIAAFDTAARVALPFGLCLACLSSQSADQLAVDTASRRYAHIAKILTLRTRLYLYPIVAGNTAHLRQKLFCLGTRRRISVELESVGLDLREPPFSFSVVVDKAYYDASCRAGEQPAEIPEALLVVTVRGSRRDDYRIVPPHDPFVPEPFRQLLERRHSGRELRHTGFDYGRVVIERDQKVVQESPVVEFVEMPDNWLGVLGPEDNGLDIIRAE